MPDMQCVATPKDIETVAALAKEIWTQHFTPIIGGDQVDYMLDRFQNAPAITRQIAEEGYEYYLVVDEGAPVGYFALVPDEPNRSMHLSKVYVKQSCRGRGLGKVIFTFIEEQCADRGMRELWLTVNKGNSDSIAFYQRRGFAIAEPIVIDIGGGYTMNDYRMAKRW